jgi:hypothetical protein
LPDEAGAGSDEAAGTGGVRGTADDDVAAAGFHAGLDIGTLVPVPAGGPAEPNRPGGGDWFHHAFSLRLTGAPGGLRTSCSVVHEVPYLDPDWQYTSAPPHPAATATPSKDDTTNIASHADHRAIMSDA